MEDDNSFPPGVPAFRAHFTDPVYDDGGDEMAPFGSDEGWDMLMEWGERRDELSARTTVRELLDESDFGEMIDELDVPEPPGIPMPAGQVDAATITIGAGFTLLRLTGHIDEEGRRLVLKALDILIARYESPPQLLRQRADLTSWQN